MSDENKILHLLKLFYFSSKYELSFTQVNKQIFEPMTPMIDWDIMMNTANYFTLNGKNLYEMCILNTID